MKNYFSGFLRALVVSLLILLQFGIIIAIGITLRNKGIYVYLLVEFAFTIVILCLLNRRANNLYKFGWLFLIAVLPVSGIIMYLLWGRERSTKKIRDRSKKLISYGERFDTYSYEASKRLNDLFPDEVKLSKFLEGFHFPLSVGNMFKYYDSGESVFDAVIEDINRAERFVFLNFFILADGELWNRVKEAILKKREEGVEIRILYDDFGSMFRTDRQFFKELEDKGILTACFNPISKYLNKLYFNYRDHQKMIIIDGNIGYTGGFNLADEYVNIIKRFGYWKDGGVRIEGPGVKDMTSRFLNMWGLSKGKNEEDYKKYDPDAAPRSTVGFMQFISDGPENNPDNPVADTIMQLIYNAKDYLYITTPYLLIEDDMSEALVRAAKSGVDVRIITPHIPDKKMVFLLTRNNYGKLLQGGVRIFEYTPGFVHAKNIVTRDVSVIGTINLDYRSLFLHYECGAVIYDNNLSFTVKEDILKMIEASEEVTYENWLKRPLWDKVLQWFLNVFSGLA